MADVSPFFGLKFVTILRLSSHVKNHFLGRLGGHPFGLSFLLFFFCLVFFFLSPWPLAGLPLTAGTDASQGCIEKGWTSGASAAQKRQDLGWLLAASAAGGKEEPAGTNKTFTTNTITHLSSTALVVRGRGLTAGDCSGFALADALNPEL